MASWVLAMSWRQVSCGTAERDGCSSRSSATLADRVVGSSSTCGQMYASSSSSARATARRWVRCRKRPLVIHRSTVFASMPTASASSAGRNPAEAIEPRSPGRAAGTLSSGPSNCNSPDLSGALWQGVESRVVTRGRIRRLVLPKFVSCSVVRQDEQ